MQIFVSDMGCVYVAAMKSVSEFPKALKMFAREVGVPEAIISDSHKCNTSKEVNFFLSQDWHDPQDIGGFNSVGQ